MNPSGPPTSPRLRWMAPTFPGLGHAYPYGRSGLGACGVPALDPKFAYPVEIRCEACLVIVGAEQVRTAVITESEQRLLDGNR